MSIEHNYNGPSVGGENGWPQHDTDTTQAEAPVSGDLNEHHAPDHGYRFGGVYQPIAGESPTPDFKQFAGRIPNQVTPETAQDTKDKPSVWTRGRKFGAAIAAFLAIGAGAGTTLALSGNDAPEKAPTATSGPAVPGQSEAPASSANQEFTDIHAAYNEQNFPYQVGEKQYTGTKEFVQNTEITVEANPTPEQGGRAFVKAVNNLLNSGGSAEEVDKFKKMMSTANGDVRVGMGAALQDYVQPAYMEALFADSTNPDASTKAFIDSIKKMNFENSGFKEGAREHKDPVAYQQVISVLNPKIRPIVVNDAGPNGDGIEVVNVPIYVDDNGDKVPYVTDFRTSEKANGSAGESARQTYAQMWHVAMKQQQGANGEMVWKALSINVEDMKIS